MITEEDPVELFLHPDSFKTDKKYINVLPGRGLQEAYGPEERFVTRTTINREEHFSRYGGVQSAYAHRMAETALAMSRVLYKCKEGLTDLPEKFDDYWQGYDKKKRPHSIHYHYLTTCNLTEVLWTYTQTPCELFFSYLACHRHLMAKEANQKNEYKARPFGRNRHYHYFTVSPDELRSLQLSLLETDLKNQPYLPSLQKFYDGGGQDQDPHIISRDLGNSQIMFGSLTRGVLANWLTSKDDYETLFAHMNTLFLAITGTTLPGREAFLRAVFEIQYWYMHIMPCERGSLAVMNLFRYTMLTYYNRRKPNKAKWLPLAPNRIDIYPDLEMLFIRPTLESFIDASMNELYCVNYQALIRN